MKTKYFHLFLSFVFVLLLGSCDVTDLDMLNKNQTQLEKGLDAQEARLKAIEKISQDLNTDLTNLKSLITALQNKVSIKSYAATATGFKLTMTDGSTINLLHAKDGKDGKDGENGKDGSDGKDGNDGTNGSDGKDGKDGQDGLNAPQIGVKQDTDGRYYWTLDGQFIVQNGNKFPVAARNGVDGNNGTNGSDGNNGANGITPKLKIDALTNQWMISYDNGVNWVVVRDSAGNPVLAKGLTGATGPTGPIGPTGPTGPNGTSGIPGFTLTADDDVLLISYMGITYTVPIAYWQVAAGLAHSMFLSPSGKLYVAGGNSFGQLGLGYNTFLPVLLSSDVKGIAAGQNHSIFLKKDGSVWGMGSNSYGQLGTGNYTNLTSPTLLFNNAEAVYADASNTFIIDDRNRLWASGNNINGNLGIGNLNPVNNFTLVLTNVSEVASSLTHTLVLTTDGRVFGMGSNADNQLGLPLQQDYVSPTLITDNARKVITRGLADFSLILKKDNSLHASGKNSYGQFGDGTLNPRSTFQQIKTDVKDVEANGGYTKVIMTNGDLLSTGLNAVGQLGNGTLFSTKTFVLTVSGVREVAAGPGHGLIVKKDNTVWSHGQNSSGQLGLGTNTIMQGPNQIMGLPQD